MTLSFSSEHIHFIRLFLNINWPLTSCICHFAIMQFSGCSGNENIYILALNILGNGWGLNYSLGIEAEKEERC